MNPQAIAHHAPETGYFVGSFSIRGPNGPATLRGPFDEIASAISRCPESTTYLFDAIADNWLPARRAVPNENAGEMVVDIPWVERAAPDLPHSVHADTLARIVDLVPVADAIGDRPERFTATAPMRIADCPNAHRFVVEWHGSHHVVAGWADVDARAPFVRWTLIARRRDGQVGSAISFRWPWMMREIEIGFGEAATLRVVCPTAIDPSDIEAQAIANATRGAQGYRASGLWLGIPHEWGGDLLGQPIVRGTSRIVALAQAEMAWQDSTRGSPWLDRWGGRANPNAPGVDASFGSTWTAPLWPQTGLPDPRVLHAMREAVHRYERRPQHWHPLASLTPDGVHTLHKGQPYDAADAAHFGIGPQFRTGPNEFATHDHEHRAVAPLAVFAALTGDVAAIELCASYLAAECFERSVVNGWVQAGRGQGLPWIAGATLVRLFDADEDVTLRWADHDARRITQYHAAKRTGPLVTVGGLYTRGSPWLDASGAEQAYSDPYEQATIAVALWLSGHVGEAFDHARSIVTGIWWDSAGRAHGAYNQRWLDGNWPHEVRVGQPINDDLRPAGDPLGMWVGAGLRVFLLAAQRLRDAGDPRGDHPWLPVARAALRDMDPVLDTLSEDGELFAAAHRSWWGAIPELVRESE